MLNVWRRAAEFFSKVKLQILYYYYKTGHVTWHIFSGVFVGLNWVRHEYEFTRTGPKTYPPCSRWKVPKKSPNYWMRIKNKTLLLTWHLIPACLQAVTRRPHFNTSCKQIILYMHIMHFSSLFKVYFQANSIFYTVCCRYTHYLTSSSH